MDPDRLRTFVDTEYPRVVGVVALLCGDRSHAEDSVQEALARACEQEARGVHIQNLAAWVTTVASNDSRSRTRRRGRELRAFHRMGPRLDPPAEPGAAADVVAVRHAVLELPMRQRQAIALRYFFGLDLAEIARELDIAEGTVKALLFQGRRRLARMLGEPDDPAESPGPVAMRTDAEVQTDAAIGRASRRGIPGQGSTHARLGEVT